MKGRLVAMVLMLCACGGAEQQPVSVNEQTKVLGSTDSFAVHELNLPKQILLGAKFKTSYATFANNRESVLQFLPNLMQRMSNNKLKLLGGVYLICEKTPNTDTQTFFLGVLASGVTGFSSNEIAYMPAGKYYSALTSGQTGKSLNLHQMFMQFLKNKNLNTKGVYAEKWLEYTEPDMTKREKIELLYLAQ